MIKRFADQILVVNRFALLILGLLLPAVLLWLNARALFARGQWIAPLRLFLCVTLSAMYLFLRKSKPRLRWGVGCLANLAAAWVTLSQVPSANVRDAAVLVIVAVILWVIPSVVLSRAIVRAAASRP